MLKWKADIPAGNMTVTEYGVDIVEVAGGLITRNEVYFDRVALLKAAGRQIVDCFAATRVGDLNSAG